MVSVVVKARLYVLIAMVRARYIGKYDTVSELFRSDSRRPSFVRSSIGGPAANGNRVRRGSTGTQRRIGLPRHRAATDSVVRLYRLS